MKTIFCLMGPTACGKTDLALRLCEIFPFEIVSVDSAMVYKGMDIGTAKPTPDILEKFPHHLINLRNANQTYSAADFCSDATKTIQEIFDRDNIPLLVGGTMLYFKALQQGLSVLPSADKTIREKILEEAKTLGWPALHEQLQKVDPIAAARIHPNDPQRIERALEVYYLTGKSLTTHFDTDKKDRPSFQYYSLGLFPENRALLHQRIEQRFKQMLMHGFVDEVKDLLENGQLDLTCPAMRMVGYRQIGEYLSDEIDEKAMIEKGIIATRQLAKRQMTWLRHWPEVVLMDPFQDSLFEAFLDTIYRQGYDGYFFNRIKK